MKDNVYNSKMISKTIAQRTIHVICTSEINSQLKKKYAHLSYAYGNEEKI